MKTLKNALVLAAKVVVAVPMVLGIGLVLNMLVGPVLAGVGTVLAAGWLAGVMAER